MSTSSAQQLSEKHCVPCEGGASPLTGEEVSALLPNVEGWELSEASKSIRRRWTAKNFVAAIDFFNKLSDLAEREGHHPDLHLTGYRQVTVELTTHAIGGLSENDFIMASKINQIPISTKK